VRKSYDGFPQPESVPATLDGMLENDSSIEK